MDILATAWEWVVILGIAGVLFQIVKRLTLKRTDISEFCQMIWERYGVGDHLQNADRAVSYVHREIDRWINKVRGILTFDGIFFVVVRAYQANHGGV
jgi:hypothetical protein